MRRPQPRTTTRLRFGVAALFLAAATVHVVLAATGGRAYGPFADDALFAFVNDAWHDVFMARPSVWALMIAAGEAALGLCLIRGGRPARWAYVGVIAFHLALMLFGWGFWIWSLPALGFIGWLAWADWRALAPTRRILASGGPQGSST